MQQAATQNRTILVTGASSGFGRATAVYMLAEGWHVIATVRKESDCESLRTEAEQAGAAERLTVVRCDITRAADLQALAAAVAAETDRLDALVNNAGSSWSGPLELLPVDDLRAQLDLNTVAQIAVTQAVLPALKRAKGTIINVSSVGGRVATPMLGPYNASKFALEALSDVLRIELAPFGVKVVVIEPGAGATEIWGTSTGRAQSLLDAHRNGPYGPLITGIERISRQMARSGFPPRDFAVVVGRILAAKRPRARYVIPGRMAVALWFFRLLPERLTDTLIRRSFRW